jgi:hypothetical protein
MRQTVRVLLPIAVVAGVLSLAGPAAATSSVVADETQYRAALTSLSADNSGAHTITLSADVTITGGTDPTYTGAQALTIDGDGHTLSGGGTRRVLVGAVGTSPKLTLTDVVIRDAFATSGGGAVRWKGPVDVVDAQLLENRVIGTGTVDGGAMEVEGDVSITGSTIVQNSAESTAGLSQGGAIQLSPNAWNLTVTDSTVSENTATGTTLGSGGALRTQGDVVLTDVVAEGNRITAGTGTASGGFLSASSSVTVLRGHFEDNVATSDLAASGGAIGAFDPSSVTDSTFTDNEAVGPTASGSAITNFFDLDLTNTTVVGNSTDGTTTRGAIYTEGNLGGTNVTIVDNEGEDAANVRAGTFDGRGFVIGQPGDGGDNCTITGTGTAVDSTDDDGTCELTGASNVPDLRLGQLRDNGGTMRTVLPLAGSPAVDLMAGGCPVPLDQRGVARPFGAACDAGAIEALFPAHPFTDVATWVEDAVRWMASDVHDPPFMTGITPTTFRGGDPITRAQVVRLLYREAGSPDVSSYPPHPFTDVPAWVEDAVRWASAEQIVTGITPTTFVPGDPITRAQVVRMKYRFAGSPDVGGYPDHPFVDVPAWVEDAVTWAANTDFPLPLVTGITPTTFEPTDDITRNQVVRMDWRLGITPGAWDEPDEAPDSMPFRREAPV